MTLSANNSTLLQILVMFKHKRSVCANAAASTVPYCLLLHTKTLFGLCAVSTSPQPAGGGKTEALQHRVIICLALQLSVSLCAATASTFVRALSLVPSFRRSVYTEPARATALMSLSISALSCARASEFFSSPSCTHLSQHVGQLLLKDRLVISLVVCTSASVIKV